MVEPYHAWPVGRTLASLATVGLLAGAAAAFAGEREAGAAPAPAATPAAHIEPALALPSLMRHLQEAVSRRTGTAAELEQLRQADTDAVARIATELAAGAQALAMDATRDDGARRRFIDNAHGLAEDAAELARLARARRYPELDAQFERVGHRCAGCHVDLRPAAR